jgi:hypothetical protein
LFQWVQSQATQRKRDFSPPSSILASICNAVAQFGQ